MSKFIEKICAWLDEWNRANDAAAASRAALQRTAQEQAQLANAVYTNYSQLGTLLMYAINNVCAVLGARSIRYEAQLVAYPNASFSQRGLIRFHFRYVTPFNNHVASRQFTRLLQDELDVLACGNNFPPVLVDTQFMPDSVVKISMVFKADVIAAREPVSI